MKVVLDSKPWMIDPSLIPMPWRGNSSEIERLSGRSLKIGVMWSDDIVTPHPSVTRGLDMMATQLKSLGEVEVVDWRPYDHMQSWEIIVSPVYSGCVLRMSY